MERRSDDMPLSKSQVSIITALIAGAATVVGAYLTSSAGLVFFPNRKLEQQVNDLKSRLENRSELSGDFEWQWTGENWLGAVKFQNLANGHINARVDMRTIKYNPGTGAVQDAFLFRSDGDGSATVSGPTIQLKLPLELSPQYLKAHHTSSSHISLEAELRPVDAFAGRVRYFGDRATEGDLILVRY